MWKMKAKTQKPQTTMHIRNITYLKLKDTQDLRLLQTLQKITKVSTFCQWESLWQGQKHSKTLPLLEKRHKKKSKP
jgi:hypothetical protein